MTVGEIADRAITLSLRHWAPLATLCVVVTVPEALIDALVEPRSLRMDLELIVQAASYIFAVPAMCAVLTNRAATAGAALRGGVPAMLRTFGVVVAAMLVGAALLGVTVLLTHTTADIISNVPELSFARTMLFRGVWMIYDVVVAGLIASAFIPLLIVLPPLTFVLTAIGAMVAVSALSPRELWLRTLLCARIYGLRFGWVAGFAILLLLVVPSIGLGMLGNALGDLLHARAAVDASFDFFEAPFQTAVWCALGIVIAADLRTKLLGEDLEAAIAAAGESAAS